MRGQDRQHQRDLEVAEIQKKGGTERGGGREGGEEQELAASCKEQTGKALMDSDDERFLQALTSFSELLLHFTLCKTAKYMFFFLFVFFKLKLIKMRETQAGK